MPKKKSNVTKVRNIKTKNVSKTIKNGAVIQTRDNYLYKSNGYVKPKYKDKPDVFYRQGAVVASNNLDELAIIIIQSGGRLSAVNKKNQLEKYNPYIHTLDDTGKPIKINGKFKRGDPEYDFSAKTAKKMRNSALNTSGLIRRNRNKRALHLLKNKSNQ